MLLPHHCIQKTCTGKLQQKYTAATNCGQMQHGTSIAILQGRTVTKRCQADGQQSQQQCLHNLPEHEADDFDEEWTYEAERSLPMYMRNSTAALPQTSRNGRPALGYRS